MEYHIRRNYDDLYNHHIREKKEMTLTILPISMTNEKPNIFVATDNELNCIYDKNNFKKNGNFID